MHGTVTHNFLYPCPVFPSVMIIIKHVTLGDYKQEKAWSTVYPLPLTVTLADQQIKKKALKTVW